MKIVVISGSPRKIANTRIMMQYVYEYTKSKHTKTMFIDLSENIVDIYRGNNEVYGKETRRAIDEINNADVWLVGSPIYNSFFSSALKNLFEFINYKNTEGKIAGLAILASGSIGFISVQTLLTQLMTYFRVIINPKTVFMRADMISNSRIIDNDIKNRLKDLVDETISLAESIHISKK